MAIDQKYKKIIFQRSKITFIQVMLRNGSELTELLENSGLVLKHGNIIFTRTSPLKMDEETHKKIIGSLWI